MTTSKPTRIVQAYLNFDGRCEDAIEFYRSAIGAEVVTMMRFKENPEAGECGAGDGGGGKSDGEKIMHCELRIGATTVMASDCQSTGKLAFEGFSLTLTVADEAEADRLFEALADGGRVEMPLGRTFWSPKFGVVADRFGVSWMVNVMP